MKIPPALPGTAAGISISCALSFTPWVLLAYIVTLLTALGFVLAYVAWPQAKCDRLLELVRALKRR